MTSSPALLKKYSAIEVSDKECSVIAEIAGVELNTVDAIVRGMSEPVCLADTTAITLQVSRVCAAYGAKTITRDVLVECVESLDKNCASLGLEEIREAYRLYSLGKIEAPNCEMYGGVLTARAFNGVIGAYMSYRAAAYVQVRKLEHERRHEAAKKAKEEARKADFLKEFEQAVNVLAKKPGITWRDVPEYWYNILKPAGLLPGLAECAGEIYQEAKELFLQEKSDDLKSASLIKSIEIRRILDDAEAVENGAKVVARKLAVFQLFISPLILSGERFIFTQNS